MSNPRAIWRLSRGNRLPFDVGGKARGLQLISNVGLLHPPSWVVLPSASESDVSALVEQLVGDACTMLAVRSSARDEDESEQSFAGIHETLLGVAVTQLAEALKLVASSPLSERANAYRRHSGLPPAHAPCAVVVQKMIPADCAGVAFGMGDQHDRVVVEAVEGLGETAVDGQAVPETLVVRRRNDSWYVEQRRFRNQATLVEVAEEGIARRTLPVERRRTPILENDLAIEIANGVAALQRAVGSRLDVEWACYRDRVWFLQARPQTRPIGDAIPAGEVWTRTNVREVLPDIPSALCRSAIRDPLDGGERTWFRLHGLEVDTSLPLFMFVYGRPVFNERVFMIGELLGVSRAAMEADLGGTSVVSDGLEKWDTAEALRHPRLLVRAVVALSGAERRARRFINEVREVRAHLVEIDPGATSDLDLLEAFAGPQANQLGAMVTHALGVAGLLARAQFYALGAIGTLPYPRAHLARLLGEGELTVSTRQLEELLDLAQVMRNWSGARVFLSDAVKIQLTADDWKKRVPPMIWMSVRGWIERYGHRGPYESDISRPRFVDDLSMLARALLPLLDGRDSLESSEERKRRRAADAAEAWRVVSEKLGRLKVWWLRRIVRDVKRLMLLREELRSETVASFLYIRRFAIELGRRLHERKRIGAPEDIWHLSMEELDRAFADPGFDAWLAVARELSRRAAWRRIEVPNRFTCEEIAELPARGQVCDRKSTIFRGNGISPGVVEGEVGVVYSPNDGDAFVCGSILVAPATDPSWTPLFARAVAVVVEIGGSLSHAGIVAREYGIPCVANIEGVTTHLRNGDVVRVDGSQGLVELVSRQSDSRLEACHEAACEESGSSVH